MVGCRRGVAGTLSSICDCLVWCVRQLFEISIAFCLFLYIFFFKDTWMLIVHILIM